MKLISITKSNRKHKRYKAMFNDGSETHFGLDTGSTYIDHKDKAKRAAYLARHKRNENWNNPKTAGSLSAHILWGKNTSLSKNIALFKKRFNL